MVAGVGRAGYPVGMKTLPDIAAATASSHAMFDVGMPVVAMVSGGADSVSLLRLLASGALGELRLSVLHVDHQLRGEASRGDAAFVEALCERLGVPCRVAAVDLAAFAAAADLNLEDAGRQVRYREADAELDARCAETGVPAGRGRIATAHTFDDRAETVLMRLAQGTGVGGLLALPYVRGRVVRPLLDVTRAEVLAYLGGLGQTWREDATNLDTTRLRARVRAEVVPLLRDINPRFDAALARTLTVLGDEDALLEEMAEDFAAQFTSVEGGDLAVERPMLRTLSRPMMRRTLRSALFAAFPEASRLEFDHVEALCDGVADDAFARDLPGGLRAFTEYDRLVISRSGPRLEPMASHLLTVPGTVDLGDAGVISARPSGPEVPGPDPEIALIDADALRGPLQITSVRSGDRIRPLGMSGTKKLSDLLIDAKVPARRRPRVPVVRDGDRIVWVAGVRMSEDYRVVPGTERTVRLEWRPRNAEGDDT